MLDAYEALHPEGSRPGALFVDAMHPNAEGHRRLAQALAEKILTEKLDAAR